jgi:hypothetical protein
VAAGEVSGAGFGGGAAAFFYLIDDGRACRRTGQRECGHTGPHVGAKILAGEACDAPPASPRVVNGSCFIFFRSRDLCGFQV